MSINVYDLRDGLIAAEDSYRNRSADTQAREEQHPAPSAVQSGAPWGRSPEPGPLPREPSGRLRRRAPAALIEDALAILRAAIIAWSLS